MEDTYYPQVMFTFFKKHANDLKGKTVLPFTTHEGSELANCVEDVKKAFPGANVQKGFSIYGHEVRTEKAKVEKWIRSLTHNSIPADALTRCLSPKGEGSK